MPDPIPEDDLVHSAGTASNFNESHYYNFYDVTSQIGGFMRLGNRVNEGHAEMTLCVYLPGGRALFDYQRYPIRTHDKFEVDRMAFEVLEPLVRHRTTYRGEPIEMSDPLILVNPGNAFRTSARVPLSIELEHVAVAPAFEPPPYGLEHAFSLELASVPIGARRIEEYVHVIQRHNEQHMRVKGNVVVGDHVYPIDGLGMRDHSWGPRTWGSGGGHSRWLTVSLRPDLGLMVQDLGKADGSRLLTGVIVRDGQLDWMRHFTLHSEWDGLFHKSFEVRFATERGETGVLEGRVLSMVPLRHMGTETVTRVGEGLTEYRLGDVLGYGLSEYFDTYPLGDEGEASRRR